jgi:hypothetical protein
MNRKFLYLVFAVLVSLVLTGCKTTKVVEVPVEVVKTEYVYRDRVDTVIKNDFIKIHDSIYVQISGDTVYKYVERIKYLNSNNNHMSYKIDTLIKIDSIPVPITNTVYKEVNKMFWWQKMFMWIGALGILGVGLWVIIKEKVF